VRQRSSRPFTMPAEARGLRAPAMAGYDTPVDLDVTNEDVVVTSAIARLLVKLARQRPNTPGRVPKVVRPLLGGHPPNAATRMETWLAELLCWRRRAWRRISKTYCGELRPSPK
jgi:hypothetical protein